jgi:hypothetical protein
MFCSDSVITFVIDKVLLGKFNILNNGCKPPMWRGIEKNA